MATKAATQMTKKQITIANKGVDKPYLDTGENDGEEGTEETELNYPTVHGVLLKPGDVTCWVVLDRLPEDEGYTDKPCVAVLARCVAFVQSTQVVTFAKDFPDAKETLLYDFTPEEAEMLVFPETDAGRKACKEASASRAKELLLRDARTKFEHAYYVMNACGKKTEKAVEVFSAAPRTMRTKMLAAIGLNPFKTLAGTAGQDAAQLGKLFARLHTAALKSNGNEMTKAHNEAVALRKDLRERFGDDVKRTNAEVDAEIAAAAEEKRAEEKAARAAARAKTKDPKVLIKQLAALGLDEGKLEELLSMSLKVAKGKKTVETEESEEE